MLQCLFILEGVKIVNQNLRHLFRTPKSTTGNFLHLPKAILSLLSCALNFKRVKPPHFDSIIILKDQRSEKKEALVWLDLKKVRLAEPWLVFFYSYHKSQFLSLGEALIY